MPGRLASNASECLSFSVVRRIASAASLATWVRPRPMGWLRRWELLFPAPQQVDVDPGSSAHLQHDRSLDVREISLPEPRAVHQCQGRTASGFHQHPVVFGEPHAGVDGLGIRAAHRGEAPLVRPGPFQRHGSAGRRAQRGRDRIDPRQRDDVPGVPGLLEARGPVGFGGDDLRDKLSTGTSLEDAAQESPAAHRDHDRAGLDSLGLQHLVRDFVDQGAVPRPKQGIIVGTDVLDPGLGLDLFAGQLIGGVPVFSEDGNLRAERFQLGDDQWLGRLWDDDRDIKSQAAADGGDREPGVSAAGTDDLGRSRILEGRAQMCHAAVLFRGVPQMIINKRKLGLEIQTEVFVRLQLQKS